MGDTFFSLADLVSRLVQGGGIADLAGAVSDDARRKLAEVVSRIRHDFAVDTNVLVLRSLQQVAPQPQGGGGEGRRQGEGGGAHM